jgi:hypothetical protein
MQLERKDKTIIITIENDNERISIVQITNLMNWNGIDNNKHMIMTEEQTKAFIKCGVIAIEANLILNNALKIARSIILLLSQFVLSDDKYLASNYSYLWN